MMLAMTKELLISTSDVTAIVVTCNNCKAQIRFNPMPEADWKESLEKDSPFQWCPLCQVNFDSTLKGSLASLKRMWKALTDHSNVSFQVNADALRSDQ